MPQHHEITRGEIALLVRKLATSFGGLNDLENRAALFEERLRPRFSVEVITQAVSRVLDESHEYFPDIGHIKRHCVAVAGELGVEDQSARGHYLRWQADPFAGVTYEGDEERRQARSTPCPVCRAAFAMSPRGYVITHDAGIHAVAGIPFSNVGKPEWFELGPPQLLPPRKVIKQLAPASTEGAP